MRGWRCAARSARCGSSRSGAGARSRLPAWAPTPWWWAAATAWPSTQLECQSSFEPDPRSRSISAERENVLFSGCPPAVEPYLAGRRSHGGARARARRPEWRSRTSCSRASTTSTTSTRPRPDHYEAAGLVHCEAAELRERWASSSERPRSSTSTVGRRRARRRDVPLGGQARRSRRGLRARRPLRQRGRVLLRKADDLGRWVRALEKQGEISYEAAQIALERGDTAPARSAACSRWASTIPTISRAPCGSSRRLYEKGRPHRPRGRQARRDDRDSAAPTSVPIGTACRPDIAERLEAAERLRPRPRDARPDARGATPPGPRASRPASKPGPRRSAAKPAAVSPVACRTTANSGPGNAFTNEFRYEILEELGRGGMGIVFKARDRRLGRIVALKRLPDNLRNHPKAVELFLREARSAAALNHPNIVTVYDAGPGRRHLLHHDGAARGLAAERDPARNGAAQTRATWPGSACRSRRASTTPTSSASFTATSRPRTSSSPVEQDHQDHGLRPRQDGRGGAPRLDGDRRHPLLHGARAEPGRRRRPPRRPLRARRHLLRAPHGQGPLRRRATWPCTTATPRRPTRATAWPATSPTPLPSSFSQMMAKDPEDQARHGRPSSAGVCRRSSTNAKTDLLGRLAACESRTCLWVLAFVFVALAAPPMEAIMLKKSRKRYGIEGFSASATTSEKETVRTQGHRRDQGDGPALVPPAIRWGGKAPKDIKRIQGIRLRVARSEGSDPAPHGDPCTSAGRRPRQRRRAPRRASRRSSTSPRSLLCDTDLTLVHRSTDNSPEDASRKGYAQRISYVIDRCSSQIQIDDPEVKLNPHAGRRSWPT